MEIYLIYIIKSLILPPTLFILCAFISLFYMHKKLGRMLLRLSVFGLLIFSLPVIHYFFAKSWETIPALNHDTAHALKPQAIVVLGGGYRKVSSELNPPYLLKERSLLRLALAAQLHQQTQLPLLVSGGNVMGRHPMEESTLMAEELHTRYAIHPRWQESRSRNTAENAGFSYQTLSKEGITRIILVTEAFHMPRALTQFKQKGFTTIPAPTGFMSRIEKWDIFMFLPSVYAMKGNLLILHEMLGTFWYQLRHS